MSSAPRIASLKTFADFTGHCEKLGIEIPTDETMDHSDTAPLAKAITVGEHTIGNRFCILPMEGWDGTTTGEPTELTRRRWRNFGISGAKLIWGGEAVAIRNDGRANPNQLLMSDRNLSSLESLRNELVQAHEERFGSSSDLLIGLQLTHSGRYARPNEKKVAEPRTAQRNLVLDRRVGVSNDSAVLTDDEMARLVDQFILASVMAAKIGFSFVDIKHCHGYLGHELLGALDREGRYGGSFENRTRFLTEVAQGIRAQAPQLELGVRASVVDFLPFRPGKDGVGEPDLEADPRYAFGSDASGLAVDLREPIRLMHTIQSLGISMVCTTMGSPYYTPHLQRPATFPPSDGYQPPEDPLIGVARQLQVTRQLKAACPALIFVGSGYTYLQDWLPNVAQAVVRQGWVDSVGLGRMVLSYPDLPADVLAGQSLVRKKICRTFSECTSAPRNGLISGCYPLDPFYKSRPERDALMAIKGGKS
jgi:2,4-dienoyl-CoA reductase-like NADH-dependent reductase (Old Yellow Enzyme family)